jgi:3-methyl-2-oxobutanoate hydroxymethyltransferase
MGHLGLTPQSVHAMGGYKVQATAAGAAEALVDDALSLCQAGCFAIVIEGVPAAVARAVTEAVPVPTIGIGAGPWCDGQVLVLHDLLGLEDRKAPRFVRRYASLKTDAVRAVSAFAADVRTRRFPAESETYRGGEEIDRVLDLCRGGRHDPGAGVAPVPGGDETPPLAGVTPLARPAEC